MCLTSGDFTNYGIVSLPPGTADFRTGSCPGAAAPQRLSRKSTSCLRAQGCSLGGMEQPEPADWPTHPDKLTSTPLAAWQDQVSSLCSPGVALSCSVVVLEIRRNTGLVFLGWALSDLPQLCWGISLILQVLYRWCSLGGSILVFCAAQLVLSTQLLQHRAGAAKTRYPQASLPAHALTIHLFAVEEEGVGGRKVDEKSPSRGSPAISARALAPMSCSLGLSKA